MTVSSPEFPPCGTAPIALIGPTASGKSALAMALAERLPVEIVSIDSAQVYRDMDIGTAKPSSAERARVAHHLIDIVDPTERYSAARFRNDAIRAIEAIQGRGHIPLLVGGTMLYVKALREGISELPPADAEVRAAIAKRARTLGWPALHAELAQVDPVTAARLNQGDGQRIQRALEVVQLTGQPMSQLIGRRQSADPDTSQRPALEGLVTIALVPADRSALHRRIAERFDAMLAAGLVDELITLKLKYELDPDLPSMRCVGYRQAWDHLEGRIDRATLRDTGIFATRQLAKRQMTWIRAMRDVTVLGGGFADLLDEVLRTVAARLASLPAGGTLASRIDAT